MLIKDFKDFIIAKKERLWLLPVITLLILTLPALSLATLSYTGITWVPLNNGVCANSTTTIRDYTIDTTHNILYLMLDNGKLQADDITGGTQTNYWCDGTITSINNQYTITYHDDIIHGNQAYYTITYAGSVPLLNYQGTTGSGFGGAYGGPNVLEDDFYDSVRKHNFDIAWYGGNYYSYAQYVEWNGTSRVIRAQTTQSGGFGRTFISSAQNFFFGGTMYNNTGYFPIGGTTTSGFSLTSNFFIIKNAAHTMTYQPGTQQLYAVNHQKASTGQSGITLMDYSIMPAVERGTCGTLNQDAWVTSLYVQNDAEMYAFFMNRSISAIKCDFTNPLSPVLTEESGITGKIVRMKKYAGTYDQIYVGLTTDSPVNFFDSTRRITSIKAITGYTGSTNFTYGGGSTGASTLIRTGSITYPAGEAFKDYEINNGLAYITSSETNGTENLYSINTQDTAFTSNSLANVIFATTRLLDVATTGGANGISMDPTTSRVYAASGYTTHRLVYASNINTIQKAGYDQQNGTHIILDTIQVDDGVLAVCLHNYNTNDEEIHLINTTQTNSFTGQFNQLAGVYTGIPGSCTQMIWDSTRKILIADMKTSLRLYNLTDYTTISQISASATVDSYNGHNILSYDTTTNILYTAKSLNGIEKIDLSNPNIPGIATYCTFTSNLVLPSSNAWVGVTSVTQTGANITGLVLYGNYATSVFNTAVYHCPKTTMTFSSGTMPLDQPTPVHPNGYVGIGIKLDNNIYYVLDQNGRLITYQSAVSNTSVLPPTTGNLIINVTNGDDPSYPPIQYATVVVTNYITSTAYGPQLTDANGITSFTLPAGDYYITVLATGYGTALRYVTITSGTQTSSFHMTLGYYPPPVNPGMNTTPVTGCQDYIKNTYLCNQTATTCTTDNDCTSGMCIQYGGGGTCATFNYRLCDAAGIPRNMRCQIRMTFQGIMVGIANHIFANFLWYILILILIVLAITLAVSMRKK